MVSEFVSFRVSKFVDLIVDPEYGRERAIRGLDNWAHQNSFRLTDEDKKYIDDAIARATKQEENKPMTTEAKTEETPIATNTEQQQEIEYVTGQSSHSSNWGKFYVKGLDNWAVREKDGEPESDNHATYSQYVCLNVPIGTIFTIFEQDGNKRGTSTFNFWICKISNSENKIESAFRLARHCTGNFEIVCHGEGKTKAPRLMDWWKQAENMDNQGKLDFALYCAEHISKRGLKDLPPQKPSRQEMLDAWNNLAGGSASAEAEPKESEQAIETQPIKEAAETTIDLLADTDTLEASVIEVKTEEVTAEADRIEPPIAPTESSEWTEIDNNWDHVPTNVETTTEETEETVTALLTEIGLGMDTLEASGIEIEAETVETDRSEQPTETPIAQPEEKSNIIQFPTKETETPIAPTETAAEANPIAEVVEKIKIEVKKGIYEGWQQNIIKQRSIKIAVKDLLIPVIANDAQRELAARAIAWADPDSIDIADIIANPPEEKQIIQWVRVKPSEMALALSSSETVERLYRALEKSDPALAKQLFIEESLEIPTTPKPTEEPKPIAQTETPTPIAPAATPQPRPQRQKADTPKQPRQPKPKTTKTSDNGGSTPSQKLEELQQLKADVDAKGKKVVAEERGYSDTSTINANLIGLSVLEQSTEVKEWFLLGKVSWSDVRETRKQINKIGLKGVIEQLRQKVQKAS